jgi:hypothetical protein
MCLCHRLHGWAETAIVRNSSAARSARRRLTAGWCAPAVPRRCMPRPSGSACPRYVGHGLALIGTGERRRIGEAPAGVDRASNLCRCVASTAAAGDSAGRAGQETSAVGVPCGRGIRPRQRVRSALEIRRRGMARRVPCGPWKKKPTRRWAPMPMGKCPVHHDHASTTRPDGNRVAWTHAGRTRQACPRPSPRGVVLRSGTPPTATSCRGSPRGRSRSRAGSGRRPGRSRRRRDSRPCRRRTAPPRRRH